MSQLQFKLIAICGMAVVLTIAPTLSTAPAIAAETPADPLLALASDVWAQFELAYRSQPAEYEQRRTQFNAVIEAWRAAPNADVADKLLAEWMYAAIQASMPGSHTPLPPTPPFNPNIQRQVPLAGMELMQAQYAPPTPARPTVIRPIAATITDPFQDDPFLDDPVSK